MDPSTSQHRRDIVVPTAIVVTKADSERWAKVLAHLQKVGHEDISFAHMTLLEEVHYIRNPAGGKVHALCALKCCDLHHAACQPAF